MPQRVIIDDATPSSITHDQAFMRGAVPRDYSVDPPEMFADPTGIPDLSLDEIAQRIFDHQKYKSDLISMRRRGGPNGGHIPSLDQNGQGYCWFYSTTMCVMLRRMASNLPYVRLSAHSGACVIKNFRNEGGWCGLSARFIRGADPNHPTKSGIVPASHWPEKSMSRSYDTAANWAEAAKYAITEDWVDLSKQVYDQNLTKKQVLINLVLNNPCDGDFNWWGHSVALAQALVRGKRTTYVLQDFGLGGINSWTDAWGDLGEFELWDSKSIPDGAICVRDVSVYA